ncbi:TetR/AcrR family transcriptional regulator [Guggenheimella bovis]
MKNVFHTDTFEKISPEKRDRLFYHTIAEFAEKGYSGASINTIAKRAEISIGSLYSYFPSKENLFFAMIQKGYEILEKAVTDIHVEEGTFLEKMERLIRVTIRYAKEHPDFSKLYLNLNVEELGPRSQELTEKVETIFLEMYEKMIREGMERGELRKDIDIPMVTFAIDNLIVMLQFSLATYYFKARMARYLGQEVEDEEELVRRYLEILKGFI